MDLLKQFSNYLKDQGVAYNTRKNYLSDLSTFVDYLKKNDHYFSLLTLPFVLSSITLNNYKTWLNNSCPRVTTNRRLSALRKFGAFAVSTNLIEQHELGWVDNTASNVPPAINEVEKFRKFLQTSGNTPNTVKGYISDIKYYLGIRNTSVSTQASARRRRHAILKFNKWKSAKLFLSPTLTSDPDLRVSSLTHHGSSRKILSFVFLGIGSIVTGMAMYLLASQYSGLMKFDRPRGVQSLVFPQGNGQNISVSLRSSLLVLKTDLFPRLTGGLSLSPKLLDPTEPTVLGIKSGPLANDFNLGTLLTFILGKQKLINPSP